LIVNPRGYGKSALVAELAYKRNAICEKNHFPSGPVLFTDFRGVKTADDAEDRILATIKPLFLPSFSQYYEQRGKKMFSFNTVFIVFTAIYISIRQASS
jgi:hypothetical protein